MSLEEVTAKLTELTKEVVKLGGALVKVANRVGTIEGHIYHDPFEIPNKPGVWVCNYCHTVMGWEAKHCSTCTEPRPNAY